MFCKNCGTENANGEKFCKKCGNMLATEQSNNIPQNNSVNYSNTQNNNASYGNAQNNGVNYSNAQNNNASYGNVQNNGANYNNAQNNGANYNNAQNNGANYGKPMFNPNMLPSEYKPISMWGYFGYQLLFGIPCIGLILLLVFAFGGTQNINLRNFARSYFCVLIIVLVLIAVFAIVGLSAGIFNS